MRRIATGRALWVGLSLCCLVAALAGAAAEAQEVRGTVVDQNGTPQTGALVSIGGKSATTNRSGEFVIEDLEDGRYTAYVQVGSGSPQAIPVNVNGNRMSPSTLSVEVAPPVHKVQGKVVDRDGKGLEAKVDFQGPQRKTVYTNSKGAFVFEGPAGAYRVTVEAGDKSGTFDVRIANNQLTPATLTVE